MKQWHLEGAWLVTEDESVEFRTRLDGDGTTIEARSKTGGLTRALLAQEDLDELKRVLVQQQESVRS